MERKRNEWDSNVSRAKLELPTQYRVSVYRKRNYLFEMNRFQDTMEITSIVQLGNQNVTIVIATLLRESRHLIQFSKEISKWLQTFNFRNARDPPYSSKVCEEPGTASTCSRSKWRLVCSFLLWSIFFNTLSFSVMQDFIDSTDCKAFFFVPLNC